MSKKYYYKNPEDGRKYHKDVLTFVNLRTKEAWNFTATNKSTAEVKRELVDYGFYCIANHEIPEKFVFHNLEEGDEIQVIWDTIIYTNNGNELEIVGNRAYSTKTMRTVLGQFKYSIN